ncbi:MAG: glycosyltransferase family 4 protein [Lachnospiraceae bacterium]|nr:glycosyltransferase family 4 protein [Lachnospiraceae bacterium]
MERKKKILFIVEAMGGGVFTYVSDLANELVNTYDMFVAYGVRSQTPADFKKYFDERVHLIRVPNFKRSISPIKDIIAYFEIRDIARRIEPDIIHLHSSKAGALGRFAFNGKKVPVFYTPHGYSFLMENHSVIKRFIYRAIEIVCGKRNCTTIACSNGEYQETLKLSKHADYVNNGINILEFEKIINDIETNSKNDDELVVFTLGRISYQKNPAMFNEIAQKMPQVKFVWVGDGELRNQLTSPNITITGWLDRRTALTVANAAHIFVLTSLWEGLPISLLEAMYMKKLCIVSDVIGNRDVIRSGYNGYVCNIVDEYVQGINNYASKGTEQLISNAYQDILDDYNIDVMTKKYKKIYQSSI